MSWRQSPVDPPGDSGIVDRDSRLSAGRSSPGPARRKPAGVDSFHDSLSPSRRPIAIVVERKALVAYHPIVQTVRDVISFEQIESEEPLRAVDALIVVNALFEALPPPPGRRARIIV